jgi:hypothetical protein
MRHDAEARVARAALTLRSAILSLIGSREPMTILRSAWPPGALLPTSGYIRRRVGVMTES